MDGRGTGVWNQRPMRLGLAAGAIAGLILAALLSVRSCRRPSVSVEAKPPAESPDAEQEKRAEEILRRAQFAASSAQWERARTLLDELLGQYGDTALASVERRTIDSLLAQIDASLVRPPPEPPPVTTIEGARAAWPAIFEDPLTTAACRKRAWLCKGQYGGRFDIHQGALVISGVHTTSAAWWHQPVRESFLLSTEIKCMGGTPLIWLFGPGYGTHPHTGAVLRLTPGGGRLTIELLRQGQVVGLPLCKQPFQMGRWYRLEALRHAGSISLAVDGETLGRWPEAEPLAGPLHAFVGFGVEKGLFGSNGIWFRNLSIRVPAALGAVAVERVLDPAAGAEPAPNSRQVVLDDFGQDGLARWVATQRADAVRKRGDRVVLHGTNAWPRMWRTEPVSGDLALEVDMAYLGHCEALNFQVRLRFGDFVKPKGEPFHGWNFFYPTGDGRVVLEWRDRDGQARPVATTSYFAPVTGRSYVLRFEKSGRRLRVFVNGRFLLEGAAPSTVARDVAVFPGFYQIYGGSSVRTLSVWETQPLPEPGPDVPTPHRPADVGAGLAESARLAALDPEDDLP